MSELFTEFKPMFRAHPWHGIGAGRNVPELINAFIEVVPGDTVKYEIDKETGFLTIDRPQKFSNVMPAMYGFIPQTYCGAEIARHCMKRTGLKNIKGDADPLDVCVLSEKDVTHGDILVEAVPIGGFRMIDGGEADDKIIAVLKNDSIFGEMTDIKDLPVKVHNRLKHYFLTYKAMPGDSSYKVQITDTFGAAEAGEIIRLSMTDYAQKFRNENGK